MKKSKSVAEFLRSRGEVVGVGRRRPRSLARAGAMQVEGQFRKGKPHGYATAEYMDGR